MITRTFSLTNFVIATSALGFQVFVLYPWHARLDRDFIQLKEEHIHALRLGEKKRLEELQAIRLELQKLNDQKTGWFWNSKAADVRAEHRVAAAIESSAALGRPDKYIPTKPSAINTGEESLVEKW